MTQRFFDQTAPKGDRCLIHHTLIQQISKPLKGFALVLILSDIQPRLLPMLTTEIINSPLYCM